MSLSLLLSVFLLAVAAVPSGSSQLGISVPLTRRDWKAQSNETDVRLSWLKSQAENLKAKYGENHHGKRVSSASLPLTDQNFDFSYYGSMKIGTPEQTVNVGLDTGSSDLWLASADCPVCSLLINPYQAAKSSTFKDLGTPIVLQYGGGSANGDAATETVTMAGYTVTQQSFVYVRDLTSGLISLSGSVVGLMGLAWPFIASTNSDPWWTRITNSGQLTEPLFAFYLARYSDIPSATSEESAGGSMDIGFTNPNLYSGNISYIPLTSQTYWLIPMEGLSVNGKSVGGSGQAAMDTGTSLIGGRPSLVQAFYANYPGAKLGTGNLAGYYVIPCSSPATVSLTFGGVTYAMNSYDFAISANSARTTCIGAIFSVTIPTTGPDWIIGDAFLKNVYTVFRSSPAAIGLAVAKPPTSGGGTSSSSNSPSAGSLSTTTTSTPASLGIPPLGTPTASYGFGSIDIPTPSTPSFSALSPAARTTTTTTPTSSIRAGSGAMLRAATPAGPALALLLLSSVIGGFAVGFLTL